MILFTFCRLQLVCTCLSLSPLLVRLIKTSFNTLCQRWRTYGTRAERVPFKNFTGMQMIYYTQPCFQQEKLFEAFFSFYRI